MDRRRLLMGLIAIAISQSACQRQESHILRIEALQDTLAPQVVGAIKRLLPAAIRITISDQDSIATLFHQLQRWQSDNPPRQRSLWTLFRPGRVADQPDWVSLNDYWLTAAIQQQLIRPLAAADLPTWSNLPVVWRSLLRRDAQGFPAQNGELWATPYRWGELVIVYSRQHLDALGWQPQTWQDLWRPDLAQQVILPDHPRLVLGLISKSLGHSVNEPDPAQRPEFKEKLVALRPQVKQYTTTDSLEAVIQGDVAVAVVWSTDARSVLSRYRQLGAVVPDPGTILSGDLWVRPRGQTTDESAIALTQADQTWLSQWWAQDTQVPLSLFSRGLSPLLLEAEALVETSLSSERLLLPTAAQIQASEFLTPLPAASIQRYTTLWQTLREVE